MLIGRDEIAALIPHAGSMCLLDGVLQWDETSIRCTATSHRGAGNPLRSRNRLHAVAGVEYASQAMAVHGRLAASGERPRAGYLASLRDLRCTVPWLDTLAGDLVIEAEKLLGDETRVIYRFALGCDGQEILSGRAAVVIDAGQP